jgi:hypothetical protein
MNDSIQRLIDYAVEKNLSVKRIHERCYNALNPIRVFCKEIEQLKSGRSPTEGSLAELISYSNLGDAVSFIEFDSDAESDAGVFRFVSVVDQNDFKIRLERYDVEDQKFHPDNKYIAPLDAIVMVMDWALANNVVLPR